MDEITISAKNLGALALPDACDRCFYWKMKLGSKLPFQIFPGIFSSIDAYTKKVVHGYFDVHGQPPPWLWGLGPIKGYVNPPTYDTFADSVAGTNIRLRGSPDGIFSYADGSVSIVDFKTACGDGEDPLRAMYETQLNVYAHLWWKLYRTKVANLSLVYTAPLTDSESAMLKANLQDEGFAMRFKAKIVPVERDADSLIWKCLRVKQLLSRPTPPSVGRSGCKNCAKIDAFLAMGMPPHDAASGSFAGD